MVSYIKNFIQQTLQENLAKGYLKALHEEWSRLDPRDFEPEVQHEVVAARVRLEYAVLAHRQDNEKLKDWLPLLVRLLDRYQGENSRGLSRSFVYIGDPDLRSIIERDYFELTVKLFPTRAWKSTVILAGSILEAVLLDRLADAKWKSKALGSRAAKDKSGRVIPMKNWKLQHVIDIAVEVGMLQTDPASTIHHVLRNYRNFVHPMKEKRAAHACTDAEAMLALGALNSVCNHIEKNP